MHGRFQPLHNGHWEYIESALTRCEYLYIGITQYRRRVLVQAGGPTAAHRAQPQSNPLTYFERLTLLRRALKGHGIEGDRYTVIPFPIEEPEELTDFLPITVPVLTTTYDDWNVEKIRILERAGYEVINLWTRESKSIAGKAIRDLMRSDDPAWEGMVPTEVARLLNDFNVPGRLRRIGIAEPEV